MAALGRRTAPLVAGALVAAGLSVAPAYADRNVGNAIDGPLTSGDSLFPNQGNGGYDVSHYDVDIAWSPDGSHRRHDHDHRRHHRRATVVVRAGPPGAHGRTP